MNAYLFALLGSAFVIAPITAISAGAGGPVPATALDPSGPWNIDWSDSQCVAVRSYDLPNRRVSLIVRPSPMGGATQLLVVTDGNRPAMGQQVAAWVEGGTQGAIKTSMLAYGISGKKLSVYLTTLTPAQFRTLDGASWLRIAAGSTIDRSFRVTQLAAVQAKLGECIADLNKDWLMTPERIARIKVEPTAVGPLSHYFSSDDYPADAVLQRNSGQVGVHLMIDEKGIIQDCAIEETSGSAARDGMTGMILRQRAKFKPAIDVDGKPTKSVYGQRVTWKLGF